MIDHLPGHFRYRTAKTDNPALGKARALNYFVCYHIKYSRSKIGLSYSSRLYGLLNALLHCIMIYLIAKHIHFYRQIYLRFASLNAIPIQQTLISRRESVADYYILCEYSLIIIEYDKFERGSCCNKSISGHSFEHISRLENHTTSLRPFAGKILFLPTTIKAKRHLSTLALPTHLQQF